MSITIELSPAEEQRLNVAAQQEGVAAPLLAQRLLAERLTAKAVTPDKTTLIRGLRGKYSQCGVSTSELGEYRQAEYEREAGREK